MENLEAKREAQLVAAIPLLFVNGHPGPDFPRLLYIGAKPGRLQMVELFRGHNYRIDAMEAWRPNVEALIKWNDENKIFGLIWKGNIRATSDLANLPKYDVVMFWHGPEHVSREDLPFVMRNMESRATRAVVFACPWGRYSQPAIDGNPFERHLSDLYEVDFEAFGYQTSTLGTKDKKGSNLLAWRILG